MEILFEVITPLGCKIRITKIYWQYLLRNKHPYMEGRENIVKNVLQEPDEIRKSSLDPSVYLYYCKAERLYCVVAKHETEKEGFIITAYPVDKIKEGEVIWTK